MSTWQHVQTCAHESVQIVHLNMYALGTIKGGEYMSTDAKRAANARHQSKLDRIVIQPPKAEGEHIKAVAAEAGQSTQAYILQAIRERIERDTQE